MSAAASQRVLIGLGSNCGGEASLARAVERLRSAVRVLRVSRARETDAEGGGTGRYWNAIAECEHEGDARALRAACKRIERELGRGRPPADGGAVPIDLDVLWTARGGASDALAGRAYWRAHREELGY